MRLGCGCFGVDSGRRVRAGRAADDGHVTGTASYRERIALPPGAVFEAVLEDVSVADAPARELGRATVADPGNPPFAFDIGFDPAEHRARPAAIRCGRRSRWDGG